MSVRWGIPVNIPKPPCVGSNIVPWQELKFNPLGLFNLCHHFGALPNYQGCFITSDIAWFATGLSRDGDHVTATDAFHQLFSTVCKGIPPGAQGQWLHKELQMNVWNLTFDLVNLYGYMHCISLTNYWYRRHCGTTHLVVVWWYYMLMAQLFWVCQLFHSSSKLMSTCHQISLRRFLIVINLSHLSYNCSSKIWASQQSRDGNRLGIIADGH